MIVLDQERLSDFFEMVSSGFGATRVEIIMVIAAIAVFVAVLLSVYLVQHARARGQVRRLERQRYEELKARLQLTPSEEDLVRQLSRYLKDPAKRHMVLVSQPAFNYCAQKLRDKSRRPLPELPRLRLKLGFTAQNPEAVPASSAEIPVGTGVLVRDRRPEEGVQSRRGREGPGDRKVQGRIVGQEPGAVVVRLTGARPGFRPGDPVGVLFQNRAGLFHFGSAVISSDEGALRLAHAEAIRRIQRRKYYRRRSNAPVGVRHAGAEDAFAPAVFVDLGGDGACLTNPGGRFTRGDTVELAFQAAGERFTLVAEVLRLSRGAERLHVRFAPMKEATRDRIIGSLFRSV